MMADKSGIEWTEATWNPTVGCSIVSHGCTNCYAMKQAARIEAMAEGLMRPTHYTQTTKIVKGNAVWTGLLVQAPDHILLKPLSWKRPRRIFVNSMSDLFHESVPDEWIDKVFAVMALCPQHTFQILTKRSTRMRDYLQQMHDRWMLISDEIERLNFSSRNVDGVDWLAHHHLLPNVWLGVSCEDQQRADERIPDLLETPAAVRFVSAEPLLGQMNLDIIGKRHTDAVLALDWIIAGGESGPKHRQMQIEWAESIRQQCAAAGTAYFFKQDSGPRSGMRGRASDALWASKQFPEVQA